MIISRNNRVYSTTGIIASSLEELDNYVEKHITQIVPIHLNQVKFSIQDDLIYADIGSAKLPFSESGFKSICSILKVPFSYLNKLISNDLILKNLNDSPNLFKDEFLFYIHTSDEHTHYISAVSNGESFSRKNAIDLLNRSQLKNNIDLIDMDYTLSNDELNAYLLTKNEVDLEFNAQIKQGLRIVLPEGQDIAAEITPFIRVRFQNEYSFDYFAKPLKRIRRIENSFALLIEDELNQISEHNLSEILHEQIMILDAAFNTSEVNYLTLKKLKSSISNTFRFQDGVYDTKNIVTDILPEYDSFRAHYKEDLKTKPVFETNNLKMPLFLPRLFSNFESHVTVLENPIFFNRQRKNVYKMLLHNADIYYSN